MSARRLLLVATGAVLLSGCVSADSGSDALACRTGDDGQPANGVVLMAQAVPSASWVP